MMKQMDRIEFERAAESSFKEVYAHPQPEGLLRVQDFLFAHHEGKRYVLLRWNPEADFKVDRFTFELQQLDPVGECLATETVTYRGMDLSALRPGEPFVPAHGIAVRDKCTDIRVQLTEVVSGEYVYRVKGTRVVVAYDSPTPWQYDPRSGRKEGLSDKVSLCVGSKRHGKVGFGWLMALLSVLLLILVIIFPYLLSARKNRGGESPRSAGVKAETEMGRLCDFRDSSL